PLTALGGTGMRIFWNGNARISTLLDGNADDNFNVEARMSGNTTNLFGSISSTIRSSLTKAAPDGADDLPPATLTIDPATGIVTWNTAAELPPSPGVELYAVQFLVTDSKGGEA